MSFLSKYRYIHPKKVVPIMMFLISFFNQPLLCLWTLSLCFKGVFCKEKSNIINSFILLQLRTLMSPGIACSYSGISSIIKWITIFILSLMLLLSHDKYANILNYVYISFVCFATLMTFSCFLFSSYPTVATFKIISYIVPFIAILKGVCNTNNIDWIEKITKPLGILLIGSIFFIPFPIGYLRNGHAFQGLFNHPNVYGVMLALYLAGVLYLSDKISAKVIFISIVTVCLTILSESRTAMFACLFSIILFLFSKEIQKKSNSKISILIIISIIISILLFDKSIIGHIHSLIYKGGNKSLLYSRESQFESNLIRFMISPLFGTGFNVPYISNIRSYAFSFDLVVENGNLILAVLGDTGIIGSLVFILCYYQLFRLGRGNKIVLFVIPFVVSMGEQSFFSTNNFAIIMYLYLSIFVADGLKKMNFSNKKYFKE